MNVSSVTGAVGTARWHWITTAYVVALLAVLYPAAASMVATWTRSETFAHGFLILPISLWLVWRDRDALMRLQWQAAPWVLLLCIPVSLLAFVARLVDVLVVQQLALVALLVLGVWAIVGTALARRLAFPLGFLFLAVPMGLSLEPPMMDLTADWTVRMVRASGVPVYQEGRFFELPSGRWSVVEACSGVRYLIASVTLGLLYAYLNYTQLWRRLLFVALAVLVPVLANVLRAYGIVMLGHASGMRLATGVDHLIYGWLFFGIVMFVLFWIGGFWQERSPTQQEAPEVGVAASAPKSTGMAPATACNRNNSRNSAIIALLALGIAALPALLTAATRAPEFVTVEPLMIQGLDYSDATSMEEGAWRPPLRDAQRWIDLKAQPGAGQLHLRQFISAAPGAPELVAYGDDWLEDDARWRVVARRQVAAEALNGVTVREAELLRGGSRLLAWSWYQIGSRQTSSATLSKVYEALESLRGAGRNAAQVYVAVPLSPALGDNALPTARGQLEATIQTHGADIARALKAGLDAARR